MTTRLIFFESRSQVLWAKESLSDISASHLVAITAEALQALEESELPHAAVSAYADARHLAKVIDQINRDTFNLAKEAETFLSDNYPDARFGGPGILTGQIYYLERTVALILSRAFLMRETIRACAPKTVIVFDGEIDEWFKDTDYKRNPWLDVVGELEREYSFHLEIIPRIDLLPEEATGLEEQIGNSQNRLRASAQRVRRYIRQITADIFLQLNKTSIDSDSLEGLRILMADSFPMDWLPIARYLKSIKGVECSVIHSRGSRWNYSYEPYLGYLGSDDRLRTLEDVGPFKLDEAECQIVSELFDKWLHRRDTSLSITLLGLELFPAFASHLKMVAVLGPALIRHSDHLAEIVLEGARPRVVCFYALPWLASKRLAYQCHLRKIPVLCYQHGGGIGTHLFPHVETRDYSHSDYFLTYGVGIRKPVNPIYSVRAKFIPVGSARIEYMKKKRSLYLNLSIKHAMNVLWVGETSTRNLSGTYFQIEDTERYLLQRRCLDILDKDPHTIVTYRPPPAEVGWDGTSRWIESAHTSVQVNILDPLEKLIHRSDVVITDTSSTTIWNEVIALQKPLILYCDPAQTLPMAHFIRDLECACYWCKTEKELLTAMQRIVDEGNMFVNELRKLDTMNFIRKYILHLNDDRSVERVISVLNLVSSNNLSYE